MHLERHHRRKPMKGDSANVEGIPENSTLTKWYFCPVENCPYFDVGKVANKHFTCLKYVRQHYQKVHAVKMFQCEMCGKTFGTEGMRVRHQLDCGRVYECDECGWAYNTRETLLTHAKRKGHVIDSNKFKTTPATKQPPPSANDTVIIGTQTTTPIQILVKLSTQTQDQGIQTDPVEIKQQPKRKRGSNTSRVGNKSSKKQKNTATETTVCQEDSPKMHPVLSVDSPPENNLNRLNFVEDADVEDSISTCLEQLVNSSGGLCDIETQTEKFSTNILDQMLYSHMHTQTCDEFLSELGLSDIQTQTNLPDDKDGLGESSDQNAYGITTSGPHDEMLVSTETQTSFTQCLLEYNEAGTNSNGITQHTQTCETLLEGLFGGQDNDFIGNFQSTYTQT